MRQKDAHSLIFVVPTGLDSAPCVCMVAGGLLGGGRVERGGVEWKLTSPTSTQLDGVVGSADGKSVVV